jgi:hypothetical protein
MAIAYRNSGGLRDVISSLWLQALAEANEDPEIRAFMRRHMAEVHAYVAAVYRRAQEAGGFVSDRDPDAEAWLSLAVGLLRASDDCLGGLVGDGFAEIDAARFEWLTGTKL